MGQRVTFRFVAFWFLLVTGLLLGSVWAKPDIVPGSEARLLGKFILVDLLIALVFVAATSSGPRRRRASIEQLENFIAAIPMAETGISEVQPSELEGLTKAMKAMAGRIRRLVDRADQELSRRETILACLAEGVLAVDNNLRVIFCNDAFARAFGVRMPVAEGRILYEIVREPVIRDILERVVRDKTPQTDRLQLPSAAGRWFEARALSFNEQPSQGAVIVLHDVTDLERQEQVRKDFVADVSHELRTPLAAIRGYAETLLDGGLEDRENNRKFVEVIQSHAIRLNNIASDLLVISELDSNAAASMAPDRVSLLAVIESAIRTVEGNAAMRGVRFDTSRCQDFTIMGFRFRLEQALVNLLDNAVKFNKPDGQVAVECESGLNGQVRLSVEDTGIGIPSEDMKRVFERFYRVDKARSRPAGGTGLGLPIVKGVIEAMGGTVTVESQLGRGTKFTILLQSA